MSKARDLANAGTAFTAVSSTELQYVDGVTSAIQSQLDAKEGTLPTQTGNSGKYLTTDGTNKSWGTVSQYALPSQTGNAGEFLTTNGTTESWDVIPAGTTSNAGILQLTNSVSSTSTTTAATPNSVKTAYDSSLLKRQMPFRSTYYYRTPSVGGSGSFTITHQLLYFMPFFVETTTTFDRIGIQSGLSAGTGTVRLGIYNDSGAGVPSTVLLDAGTVSATSPAGTTFTITISQTLNPGFYWLAFCQQGTSPGTPSYTGSSSTNLNLLMPSSTTASDGVVPAAYTNSGITGAFTTATTLSVSTRTPFVYLRAA